MKGTSGFFLCEFIERALVGFREEFLRIPLSLPCVFDWREKRLSSCDGCIRNRQPCIKFIESRARGVSMKNDENT